MKSGLPSASCASSIASPARSPKPSSVSRCAASSDASLRVERSELERGVRDEAAAPRRSEVEKLRTREHDDEDRQVTEPRREELDEIEQAFVAPMEVLEDEHRRPVGGDGLDEGADREEEALAVGDRARRVQSQENGEMLGNASRLGRRSSVETAPSSFCSADSTVSFSKIPQSCFSWKPSAA